LPPEIPALRREQFSLNAVVEQLGLKGIIKGVHLCPRTTKLAEKEINI
jgi:hypothetical protein